MNDFTFYEFFAGGGMARIGLGPRWTCLFANDNCPKKARAYLANFSPAHEFKLADVRSLTSADLPGQPTLVWASFPCQDLSLAGDRRGLDGKRSGTFWPFWNQLATLAQEGRQPPLVVLENVVGAVTSHGGRDFAAILESLVDLNYVVGALVMDAVRFIPQSRPRLFIVASSVASIAHAGNAPAEYWHPKSLRAAVERLPPSIRRQHRWWHLPLPQKRLKPLASSSRMNPAEWIGIHPIKQTA